MTWHRTIVLGVILLSMSGSAWAYRYWEREALAKDIENQVGEKVRVIDEVISIHPEKQTIPGYFKFDTVNFRCLIPKANSDAIDYVKKVATDRPDGSRRTKRIVALDARVEREEVYGRVGGKDGGVRSEVIFLVVDRAFRPRARYFREFR